MLPPTAPQTEVQLVQAAPLRHIAPSELGLAVESSKAVQYLDGVVVDAPALRGLKIKTLVRTQSARLENGRVLHWSVRGDLRHIESLTFAPPASPEDAERAWQVPANAPSDDAAEAEFKGGQLLSGVETRGHFIGAWRCGASNQAQIAIADPRPQGGWSPARLLATVNYRFDLIGSEPIIHEQGAPIVLVRLDPDGLFHYARFYWSPTESIAAKPSTP